MKKLFAATVSVVALSVAALYGASAFAADLPTKAPVYKAAAPGYNWTGWYGGVNVGVGVSETHGTFDGFISLFDLGAIGFAGGMQAGYNWQVAPQWVFGLEGDIGYLGIERAIGGLDVKTDWYGTLRGRLGYSNGPSLVYATGGAAFVSVKNNVTNNDMTGPVLASKSETATGWTAGAGIETMLGGNWSAKAEYLYIDVGREDVFNPLDGGFATHFDNRFHVYRYGLNYRFGGPAMASVLPARNWSGFYAGMNGGMGLSQVPASNPPGVIDIAGSGFTGGVQAGYNWQLAPQWVFGVEGDIGWLGIDRSLGLLGGDAAIGVKTDWYGTLRGRLGYSTGPALLYVTGGAAFVNVRNNLDNVDGNVFVAKSKTATGWTMGGGIEAALAQNWTAKTEYLYIDAGSQDVFNPSFLVPTTIHFDNRFHVFRAGLNYQFNAAPAPVAARY